MTEYRLQEPILFVMLGLPGSGKSYTGRNLSEVTRSVHINIDDISKYFYQKFEDRDESSLIDHAIDLADKFLENGASVVFDGGSSKRRTRHELKKIADKNDARYLVIWVQTDEDTAFRRASNRDMRKIDDRSAYQIDEQTFTKEARAIKKPEDEQYVVVSGKHHFKSQLMSIKTKLIQIGVLGRPTESPTTQIRILTPDPKRRPHQFQHRNARLQ